MVLALKINVHVSLPPLTCSYRQDVTYVSHASSEFSWILEQLIMSYVQIFFIILLPFASMHPCHLFLCFMQRVLHFHWCMFSYVFSASIQDILAICGTCARWCSILILQVALWFHVQFLLWSWTSGVIFSSDTSMSQPYALFDMSLVHQHICYHTIRVSSSSL